MQLLLFRGLVVVYQLSSIFTTSRVVKNNKAPEEDQIHAELIKEGGDLAAQVMQHHLENNEVARTMDTGDICTAAQDW